MNQAEEHSLEHDWFTWPIPENVKIGRDTWVYSSFAFLHFQGRLRNAVVIGKHSGIYNGTFFDLGPRGNVRIGDYCSILGAILSTNGRITLSDYIFIAHEVTIADHAFATSEHEHSIQSSDVFIGDNVWIGARSIILGGVSIGEGSVIGAGSVVDFDVPSLSVVAGNPGQVIRTLK